MLETKSPYKHDGIIFTNICLDYSAFRNNEKAIFKWKPKDKITIDFYVKKGDSKTGWSKIKFVPTKYRCIDQECVSLLFTAFDKKAYSEGDMIKFANSNVSVEKDGIYECYFNGCNWDIIKERTDKRIPNILSTVTRTISNIEEDITIEDLDKGEAQD